MELTILIWTQIRNNLEHLKGGPRIANNLIHGGSCWNMVIPAIWEVIWGLVDLFPTFNRPPNTFRPKDRHSKKIIFTNFQLLTEAAIIACKVLSKESHPQVKKLEIFFRKLDLSEFSSDSND